MEINQDAENWENPEIEHGQPAALQNMTKEIDTLHVILPGNTEIVLNNTLAQGVIVNSSTRTGSVESDTER